MTRLYGFTNGSKIATKDLNWNESASKPTYRVNKDGRAKPLPTLKTKNNTIESRTIAFLNVYWHSIGAWNNAGLKYWIKPEVLVCIARSDTHLWYATKSKNNIWNVWNNDRWDTVEYDSIEKWINAIAYTLNNVYLWSKQTIGDLSFAGDCKINCSKVYATSNSNRQNNLLNCLSLIHNKQIEPDFIFRN